MNNDTAVFLINPATRAVRGRYNMDDKNEKPKLFKTFDASIKVDDLVVVPSGTRHQFTVVKIIEADIDLDMDTTEEVKWIVCKIDVADFERTLALEADAISKIRSAELRRKRERLAEDLLANSGADFKTLAIGLTGGPKE